MNVYVREYKKIEHRTRRRDSFVLRYLPALLLISGAVVVGKIYVQSVALRWSRDVVELRERTHDLELRNEDLARSIATLTTRERVARDAADELGMTTPSGSEVMWLTVVERAGRGAGAPDPGGEGGAGEPGMATVVFGWFDALWQEEALALTSR
ncbi:MAG TPA: hypothetical protein VM737_00390 [Gemmatimonadota bacterium]|nr:hypothetical protein [Gemmatimonadota bacterium]